MGWWMPSQPNPVPLYGSVPEAFMGKARAHRTKLLIAAGALLAWYVVVRLAPDLMSELVTLSALVIIGVLYTVAFFSAGLFAWGPGATVGAWLLSGLLGKALPGLSVLLAGVLVYRLTEIANGKREPRDRLTRPT
ncbi:dipeptide transport system permease protein DppB (ABC transporter) [Anaeromyxobacter sp. K]|uniref:hypothetical protein n=1 Tax=Anaeromyxobacter sp. (strain K) TaxID=447217 RepID=UPI00015F9A14|nr:hypothetical protein [Anaeromyxobacter sp. K]ACG72325.1 dipeptide transport system permease protein DppB (ABC transporter) [Anaeromyxobacter sp. K]